MRLSPKNEPTPFAHFDCSMRHRLLNHSEEVTYESLTRVCESNGARVFPKVRLADVFAIEKSGLSSAHFSYCLRSHFDFLVTDKDYRPQFSVEFDGPLHKASAVQRQRDLLKNNLCEHFGHGLLRVNSKYLTPAYRGLDLLTYFVDAWFLAQAFDEAQKSGAIPYDEPFDITFIYSTSDSNSKKWPYWLTLDIQAEMEKLHLEERIGQMAPSHHVGTDNEGNYRCMSWLVVDAMSVLSVTTGMRAQRFSAVDECDLVSMLAMFDLYRELPSVLSGTRGALMDRNRFFQERLPAFQQRYPMVSATSFGAIV
jgi:hypothetical protein